MKEKKSLFACTAIVAVSLVAGVLDIAVIFACIALSIALAPIVRYTAKNARNAQIKAILTSLTEDE